MLKNHVVKWLHKPNEVYIFSDEPRSPTMLVELPGLSDSGLGTLLADKMAHGAREFWSGNHEDRAWVHIRWSSDLVKVARNRLLRGALGRPMSTSPTADFFRLR